MNLKILYNLWQAKRSATPSRAYKRALWQKLSAQMESPVFWYRQVWFRWSMVGAASLLVVMSLGTGAYAYNSPEVTENSPLYPIKQVLEKVEEATKMNPEAKAQFLLKQIARREAEKQVMQRRGQTVEKIEAQIDKTANQLQKTDETLEKLEAKRELKDKTLRPQVQQLLDKRLEKRREQLGEKKERIEARQEKIEDKKIRMEEKLNSSIVPNKKSRDDQK